MIEHTRYRQKEPTDVAFCQITLFRDCLTKSHAERAGVGVANADDKEKNLKEAALFTQRQRDVCTSIERACHHVDYTKSTDSLSPALSVRGTYLVCFLQKFVVDVDHK